MTVIRRPGPPPEDAGKPRLGTLGQVYVTLAAAEQYQRTTDMRIEEARRDLTELLLDAREQTSGSYRYRRKSDGVDISARVVREGKLLVVVSVNARGYGGGNETQAKDRR